MVGPSVQLFSVLLLSSYVLILLFMFLLGMHQWVIDICLDIE